MGFGDHPRERPLFWTSWSPVASLASPDSGLGSIVRRSPACACVCVRERELKLIERGERKRRVVDCGSEVSLLFFSVMTIARLIPENIN